MSNIDKETIEAIASGAPFRVEGYRPSEGGLYDMQCCMIGYEGYLELVKASLDKIPAWVDEDTLEKLRTLWEEQPARGAYEEDLGEEALAAVRKALVKKLEPPTDGGAGRDYASAPWFFDGQDPCRLVLLRLAVHEVEREPAEKKGNPRPLTLYKNLLESRLPVFRYRHRINLYPGKFEKLTVQKALPQSSYGSVVSG